MTDKRSELYKLLNKPRGLRWKIRNNLVKLEELSGMLTGGSVTDYDRISVKTSPSNRMEDILVKIADIEEENTALKKELADVEQRLTEAFAALRGKHGTVLKMVYLDNMTYAQIAKTLEMSEAGVYKIRRLALDEVQYIVL
jgi:RNA polymerase sigma factor (sigma-70 family)